MSTNTIMNIPINININKSFNSGVFILNNPGLDIDVDEFAICIS